MQVSYTTTIDDYVVFSRYAARKSPSMWSAYLMGWLTIPVIAVGAAIVLLMIDGLWIIGLIVGASGLLFAAIYPPIYRVYFDGLIEAHARERGTQGIIGAITLILTDEKLVEITEITRSEVRWVDMKGVVISGDYLFIYVTGMSVAIVPRHGFETEEEFEAVRDFALTKLDRIPA